MSTTRLRLAQLAPALQRYGDKYTVFDVFAADVEELYALGNGEELDPALNATRGGNGLRFTVDGKRYRLALTEKSGMARITPVAEASDQPVDPPTDPKVFRRLIASAIALAISVKGEGWLPGLFIGVLTGRCDDSSEARSVTVRYDAVSRQWRAYGGAMSQWLREAAAF